MTRNDVSHKTGDFSCAIQEALRKRRRALSRRGASVSWTCVKEIVNGRETEKGRTDVTIDYRVNGLPVTLRMNVWADRWVWIDARCSTKQGWLWEFTDEGRFISKNGARALVQCAEKTIDASFLPARDAPSVISKVWSTCLASGPRPL